MAITSAKAITSATMSSAFTSFKAIRSAYMYSNNTNHTQRLEIIKKNIFPYTLWVFKNYWENIFFRPEETMFDNWQKLVSTNKNQSCS